jgi:hypothetical protein
MDVPDDVLWSLYAQGIDYLCKRIGVKQSQMDLEGHRILATAACSLVGTAELPGGC